MKTPLSPLALLLLGAAPVAAQDIELAPILVFGNQTETRADQSGTTAEIVEGDELAGGEIGLAQQLSVQPGVTVSTTGGLGGVTVLRLRGLDGKYVGVRIDGIDVTDPSSTQTQFDWGALGIGNVGRVEILKGSQSAIFGSEAIGGVVNITTPRATEPGTQTRVWAEAGSNETRRAGLNVVSAGERGQLSFGLAHVRTEGFSASSAGTEPDGMKSTQLNLAGEYDLTDDITLGFAALAQNIESDFDEFGGDGAPPYDEVATSEIRGARLWARATTGAVTHTLGFSGYRNDRDSTSNGTRTPFLGTRRGVDYKTVWDASERFTLTGGFDVTREGFEVQETDFSAFPAVTVLDTSEEIETRAVFAEALFAPDARTDLAFSLRHDDHSDFGGQTSGRIALAFRPRPDLILRAVASTGFRAPSLYELHSQIYGNAALSPETSRNFELGVEKRYGEDGFVKLTAYNTDIEDLITYDFTTDAFAQIGGTSRTRGIELSGRAALGPDWAVFGSYTLADTRAPGGARLPRVPRHDLVLGVEGEVTPRLTATLTVNHVADRPDDGFPARKMDDYTLVNAAVSYAISDSTEAYLRIENLTDTDYESVAGFNTGGRQAFFGIRAAF